MRLQIVQVSDPRSPKRPDCRFVSIAGSQHRSYLHRASIGASRCEAGLIQRRQYLFISRLSEFRVVLGHCPEIWDLHHGHE